MTVRERNEPTLTASPPWVYGPGLRFGEHDRSGTLGTIEAGGRGGAIGPCRPTGRIPRGGVSRRRFVQSRGGAAALRQRRRGQLSGRPAGRLRRVYLRGHGIGYRRRRRELQSDPG